MARQRKQSGSEDVEVDLTPMIDVVFLLIIFFLVVTQITTQDNVNLRLPDALAANEEPDDAKKIFTVHIAPVDQARAEVDNPDMFGWFCFGEARARSADEMKSILEEVSRQVDPGKDYTGRDGNDISQNMIYVRSDARAPAGLFAKLIELMVSAKMYKIKVGIMKDVAVD